MTLTKTDKKIVRQILAEGKKPKRPQRESKAMVKVMAPTAVGTSVSVQSSSLMKNGLRVQHREYVNLVTGQTTSTGACGVYLLNPGRTSAFPWMSTIASAFESYVVHDFKVHYVPRCATTETGSITLAIDYDAEDPDPLDRKTLTMYQDTVTGSPWMEICLTATRSNLKKRAAEHYVSLAGDAKRQNDFGKLIVWAQGQSTGGTVGEMWVSYDITFLTPNLPALDGGFSGNSASPTILAPLTSFVETAKSEPICYAGSTLDRLIFRRPGTYSIFAKATGIATGGNPFGAGIGAVGDTLVADYEASTGTRHVAQQLFNITQPYGEVLIDYTGVMSSISSWQTIINRVIPDLY